MTRKDRSKDRHSEHRLIRIPLSLYKALKAIADINNRPASWEARLAIQNHVKEEQRRHAEEEGEGDEKS